MLDAFLFDLNIFVFLVLCYLVASLLRFLLLCVSGILDMISGCLTV